MTLHPVANIDPALPQAYFLLEENKTATQALLPAYLKEVPLNAEAEELTGYLTPTHTAFFYGLGITAEVTSEKLRKAIHKLIVRANELKLTALQFVFVGIKDHPLATEFAQALGEIPFLSNYQFLIYRKEREKLRSKLAQVLVHIDAPQAEQLLRFGESTAVGVTAARDLVNEPPNILTAVELAKRAAEYGKQYGFAVEVLDKKRIESLKMGGLLAVNRGSLDPPTFSILEYRPAGKAVNTKPIVLVGKGIVFDTGGLTLKPTPGGMDTMKCDMAGGAAVIGAFIAAALNKLPVHLVGLIPSTDNRPGEDAFTPNDVITMYDGSTVEVLNTDAEGRMILADALAFAKQYDPELVIDLATLTGAAVIAVGPLGIAMLGTAGPEQKVGLVAAAERTYERVVELPLWAEYKELLKSEIADMKNVGGRAGGSITAAKFLEQFTAYPWIHLDIAGPAFLDAADSYRGKQGTGYGVRLLVDFLKHLGE